MQMPTSVHSGTDSGGHIVQPQQHSHNERGSAVFASTTSNSQADDAQDTELSSAVDQAMTGSAVINALDDYSFKLWCTSKTRVVLPCISLATRLRLQSFLDNTWTTLFFLLLTIYSLFIIDTMQLAMDADAERPVFWTLLGVVVAFSMELVRASVMQKLPVTLVSPFCSQAWASIARPRFFLSFFWWLDTLATVSIALSIPFSQLLERNCDAVDSTSLAFAQAGRTVRLVRQGGRALRVLRVLRIVQLFRFFRWIANTVSGRREKRITSSKVLEASRLGEQLAYVSARKVVMIIIILSAVLPFYVDEDSHVLAQRVGMLQLSLQGSRGATRQQLSSSLVALSQPEEFDVLFLRVNGTVLVDNPAERARLRCEELSQVSIATESGGEDLGVFGNENVLNSRSVFNIVYICLVLLVLMVSTVLFNRDTRKYVVKPMMRVIKVINELRTRVAETVLSFDETGWDPAHVERTVYDMALWIETQQARNLLPTSEEKRLEALQRAQRRAEERQSAAAAAAAAAASRSSTPTRGGSMSKSPPSVSGGTGSVAARGRPAAGGGSMVLFGSKKHDGGGSDIRRQKSEQHTRTAAGAGIGGSTIFSTARDGLRRLWREARGVDSDDEDVLEQEPSPTDSPMPSPRHSSVVSDAGHTVMSAPAGGSFTLRRRRSMSAGAASEARRQASRRSKRHIVEEIPLPLVQHAAEQSTGGRTESGMARSGGGGSLILSSKPSLRSMVVHHNSTTPSRGVTTAPALSSPGDNVLNPAGQQPYTPVTPLQAGAGASPRLPPAVPGGGSIVLYSDGSYALKSPDANTAESSFHLGPVAVPVQMAGAVSGSDGDTKHSPQRGGGRQAADAGSVASSSQGGSRSGTTILQVALAGGRMGDARTQRALAGSPGGVVAHGRYGRRGSIDHRLLNQFYSQRLAEMQSGRIVSPASAQGGDGGSSVLSHHSRGGRSSSTRSASRGGQEALQPRPQQPLGGSLLMEPSRLRDLSGTSSGGKSSASSKPPSGRGDASADGSHAGHASDATHITPLSDDDEVPDTLNTSANRKAAPIGTSSLVLFSQRQLQEGAAKPPLAPHTQPRNMRSGRKRAGSSNASDEHDIAKYYTSEEGGEGGGEIEHGDSYGSMAGYLQEESIPHSTQGGVGPVQELGGTDDLDAYLQAEGVASVGSDEDEVHVTLDDEGEGTHYSVLAPTGLSVATGPPAAAAAGGTAEAAAEWRSPWSLTADEEAAVEAAQTARYREALKEVMKSAARRGEDLGSAIDRKQRKGGGR